ncbi:MAG TPA: phosphoserine phosphatase SerB [Pseudoclavibacter sp.]|nr:phosphoserine phosphatase SerB [Pseudoclavibacter sp.]
MISFVLVADVDSTLIKDEVIELLADAAGTRAEVAQITARAMAGDIDFAESLRERVATLRGLPESVISETIRRVRPSNGLAELVDAVHRRQGRIGAVSGGFSQVLDVLAPQYGIDMWRANSLSIRDGHLLGEVTGTIVDARVKAQTLRQWSADLGLPSAQVIAMGDGANDLLMMDEAGLSIAYCAKPRVREHAQVSIDVPDLREVIPYLPQTP